MLGLYGLPPAHAIVLSVGEQSQIQALDCTQPELALKRGRGATMTHDYKRNGSTTPFAALNILGKYATQKQPKVRAWLARHPCWTFHFVPTSGSWLNAVEDFFAKRAR